MDLQKTRKLVSSDWRQSIPLFQGEFISQTTGKGGAIKGFSQEKGRITKLALAWLLAQDGVDAVIPGENEKNVSVKT